MQKSLKSQEYGRLVDLLVAARNEAGIRQHALASKLKRPQSFVAKYENGERRIDIVDITIARALDADPLRLFKAFLAGEEPALKPSKSVKKSR